jgi:hypothetical protein
MSEEGLTLSGCGAPRKGSQDIALKRHLRKWQQYRTSSEAGAF